jgi:hypothetical protein
MTRLSESRKTGPTEPRGDDEYDIQNFAAEDPQRFHSLLSLMCPRDQEILICFAVLQKRPTDLSILFGKAAHRAEEDLRKAVHKLSGLIEFGELPDIGRISAILERRGLEQFGTHSLAACIWQYARCRDFAAMSKLIGNKGLRQKMLNTFKTLHGTEGREEGLLAGWIYWLVADANEHGKGWRKRRRGTREHKLGPTVFRTIRTGVDQLQEARATSKHGGEGQKTCNVKIPRRMKFIFSQ